MFDDVRFALRRLRSTPGFTATAILTLAVAVGANTAVLSIADGVLFRPLPYADPDRLFVIQQANRLTGDRYLMVPHDELEVIRQHSGLSDIGLWDEEQLPDGPRRIPALAVNAAYMRVLGVEPAAGRIFNESDASTGRAAMLSYAAWRDRFGGDQSVVGSDVTLGDSAFDVVGILPRGSMSRPTPHSFPGPKYSC